jgi:hypothetical protein
MAICVCCPCGYPLDCDNLELLVSVSCPRCKKELTLELGDSPERRKVALLTIMEGPHWVGEQFVVPVGENVVIGKAASNWLPLEGDGVSDVHCVLRLTNTGSLVIEDKQSHTGTWVGQQRIARGKLGLTQSFRVGEFRLRLDLQGADGSTVSAAQGTGAVSDEPRLPTMHAVTPKATIGAWLVRNRFILSRNLFMAMAWLAAAYHMLGLHQNRINSWSWRSAVAIGLCILTGLSLAGRRVTLAHQYFKYVSLVVLVLLAVVDMTWQLPAGAIAALGLAACLSLLCLRVPSQILAAIAALTGSTAVLIIGIATCKHVMAQFSSF